MKMPIKINGVPLREYVHPGHKRGACRIPASVLRETLKLRDEEGKSFKEIGEMMGVTRGSACYRYRRAKEILDDAERTVRKRD